MHCEILWTDTARADLDAVSGTVRDEITGLVEQIVAGEGADHVLSAGREFELRYQKQGSTFVFFRRAAQSVTVLYFCEMSREVAAAEPQVKIVDLQTRDIPNGMEAEGTYAYTAEDGTTTLRRTYVRKIDLGESYTVFHHMAITGRPTFTSITNGRKGPIDGDFRKDEIELVILHPDGSVERHEPQTVPVWIQKPELTPEQLRERFQGREDVVAQMQKWRALG